jgi:hypothetical protein
MRAASSSSWREAVFDLRTGAYLTMVAHVTAAYHLLLCIYSRID